MVERMPYGQLSLFTLCNIANGLSVSAIYPYASNMVMDFGLTDDRTGTGYYVGFLCGGLMIGRSIGALFWGWLADKHGRKPVLLISLLSISIGSLVLGTAQSFPIAVGSLFLSGLFCTLPVMCKTCVSEVTPKALQAKAMACYAMGWYYGQIAGFSVGGLLVHPEKTGIVSGGLFADFPYLLPNLICAFFAFVSLLGVLFFFRETLSSATPVLSLSVPAKRQPSSWSFLRSSGVVNVFLLYSLQVFCNTGFVETYPLWCWASKKDGGLEFDPQEIGGTLSIAYVVMICVQSWLYSRMVAKLGLIGVIRGSSLILIPVLLLFPFVRLLVSYEFLLKTGLVVGSLLYYLLGFNIYTSVFVLTNNSVMQEERAKVNGCSMAFGYIVKGVTPLVIGYTFAFTSQKGLFFPFDSRFVFILMAAAMGMEVFLAKTLPRTLENPKVNETVDPETLELTVAKA